MYEGRVQVLLALEIFDRNVPNPGLAVVLVALVAGFFLISRSDPRTGQRVDRGVAHRCERCGTKFQPNQGSLLNKGDATQMSDQSCPRCGWVIDWREPP